MTPIHPTTLPGAITMTLGKGLVCLAARGQRRDTGQTTAEYGLVILAAGTLALAVILWARSSGSITGLFDSIISQLTGSVGG